MDDFLKAFIIAIISIATGFLIYMIINFIYLLAKIKMLKLKNRHEYIKVINTYLKNKKENFYDIPKTVSPVIDNFFQDENYKNENIITIKGEWGSGKSFYLAEIMKLYSNKKQKKYKTVYFDLAAIESTNYNKYDVHLYNYIFPFIYPQKYFWLIWLQKSFLYKISNFLDLKIITKKPKQKTIVFLDNLDRCSSRWNIITILMCAELFASQNVLFILTVNENILNQAIKEYYNIPISDSFSNSLLFLKKNTL